MYAVQYAPVERRPHSIIREEYRNRCGICLTRLPRVGCVFVPFFDSVCAKGNELDQLANIGVLRECDVYTAEDEESMIRCPTCHFGYFKPRHIGLSLPLPILQYIRNYLEATSPFQSRPLHEVFDFLVSGVSAKHVSFPDRTDILPYIGLYTIVPLEPDALHEMTLLTPSFPNLSILEDNAFVPADPDMTFSSLTTVRIFDVLNPSDISRVGTIPLSPFSDDFTEQRYWRLPARPEHLFATFMLLASGSSSHECAEIEETRWIKRFLEDEDRRRPFRVEHVWKEEPTQLEATGIERTEPEKTELETEVVKEKSVVNDSEGYAV